MQQWRKRPKGQAKRVSTQRARAEQKLREAANKLRQRLPVKDKHRERIRHERMVRAASTSHAHIPGLPRGGWW